MKKTIAIFLIALCLFLGKPFIRFSLPQAEEPSAKNPLDTINSVKDETSKPPYDCIRQAISNGINQKKAIPLLKEIGLLTGYARGDLIELGEYKFLPFLLRFGFDLKPFLQKFNFLPKGIVELVWEPFINPVISPDVNIEAGITPLLKYAYPLNKRLHPYAEAGAGFIYISQHTREQGTQFNFIPQIGLGMNYFFKENTALNIAYRYRHLSNSSIKSPNKGINAGMILAGISYFF